MFTPRHAQRPPKASAGFTLIELLIVVAIIAVLAAIAVPNFLEAQTRSKVSREKNDLRVQAVAMEAYAVDWNTYTRDSDSSLDTKDVGPQALDPNNPVFYKCANGAIQLTTPIAYMTTTLTDPFVVDVLVSGAGARGYRIGSGTWSYPDASVNAQDNQQSTAVFAANGKRGCFVMIGVGPDKARARCGYKCFPFQPSGDANESPVGTNLNSKGQPMSYTSYDPTNGTNSVGDVYYFGGGWQSGRFMLDGQAVGQSSAISPAW